MNVLGISYSQTQSGAYALVLAEESGDRRIPIIIGGFEAQAIAIQLEGLKPPRPLTHDLFLSFSTSFGISIIEVIIYKLEEGVFYSKLVCEDSEKTIAVDARTSDAIALALRFKCPIYTTEDILAKSGIILEIEKEDTAKTGMKEPDFGEPVIREKPSKSSEEFKDYSLSELKEMLQVAIRQENYERASEIRDELNKRSKNS